MKILTIFVIIFYTLILSLIGASLIIFSLNMLAPQDMSTFFSYMQATTNSRLIVGLSGGLIILISFALAQLILGGIKKENSISFSTPYGEGSIAISAISDLIRQISLDMSEIKELRPTIQVNKRGVVVDLRVILRCETNFHDLASRLQEITKSKIREVRPSNEEDIVVRVHFAKIIAKDERDRKRKDIEKIEPIIPYSGYGRA